jgi:release factor glutamine methyltransferase
MRKEETWTIGRLLEWTSKFLHQKGIESPRLDSEVLLANSLQCKRIELYTRYEEVASEEGKSAFRSKIEQRLKGCPVAYLVGKKEFFSLELEVTRDVLIPRPDSETLVSEGLQAIKDKVRPRVLDLGTGSGNLAVAIAHQKKDAEVTAVDLSPQALEVARRNAVRHKVDARIRFFQGDLFSPLSPDEQFDLIVSNPPYIPQGELAGLEPGVRDYEPMLALDGGPDGFAVTDRILAGAHDRLAEGGSLMIEIHALLGEDALGRAGKYPQYAKVTIIPDLSDHPRVLWLTRFAE